MSMGRQEAFDIFMRDYREKSQIETNKQMLKQRYSEAKSMGEKLNKSKQKMNQLKSSLAQYRLHYQVEHGDDQENESEMEQEIKFQMEEEKRIYKDTFTSLRSMKSEIEHVQHLLENSKVKLMKDFELWWAEQSQMVQSQRPDSIPPPNTNVSAWNTPPVTPPTPKPPQPPVSQRSHYHDPDIRGSNSSRLGRPSSKTSTGGFPLTGDSNVDADIEAFVRARQNILHRVQGGQR